MLSGGRFPVEVGIGVEDIFGCQEGIGIDPFLDAGVDLLGSVLLGRGNSLVAIVDDF